MDFARGGRVTTGRVCDGIKADPSRFFFFSSSRAFAKKVLQAIQSNSVASLTQQAVRKDALKSSQYYSLLREFCFREENARAVPGNDTVSIRRGIRVPKFIAMKSMDEILTEFLKENPNCSFKKRVLLREVPQNIVRPTARDFCRNCCVCHSNVRHTFKALR